MAKTNTFNTDQYNTNNKDSIFPFYDKFFMNSMSNVFARALSNSTQFNTELYNAFAKAYQIYLDTISEYNRSWKDFAELDKALRSRFHKPL